MANLKEGCTSASIDSNITGLRYAEEDCPGVLPDSPNWVPLEPNSYSDFSADYTLSQRDTINPNRQLRKGAIVDVDATFGITQDLTKDNFNDLLQGFFFATAREKVATKSVSGTVNAAISSIGENNVVLSAAIGVQPGDLVLLSGFTTQSNNGLKLVASVQGATITFTTGAPTIAEAVPTTAVLQVAGKAWAAGGAFSYVEGEYLQLALDTDADSGTISLIPGEWVYFPAAGSVSASNAIGFVNNVGYARVHHINVNTATEPVIYFDKWSWVPAAESIATPVAIMTSTTIRNEEDENLIIQRSYQFERTLGRDTDGVQSEYSVGAVANELTLNVESADKLTVDIGYVAMHNEERTGAEGVKEGTRNNLSTSQQALNATTDVYRINLSTLQANSTLPNRELFSYCTSMSMVINNNVSARKAIGKLGAIGMNCGNFEVTGSVTAYFTDVRALRAIRNCEDVSIDCVIQRDNSAQVWDIPLLALSNGAIDVEKDEAITIPLDINGAESEFGYTMQYSYFPYIPQ